MKKLFVAGAMAIVLSGAALPAQNAKETPKAQDVGPGGFEMTTYYVGFLYKGPKWSAEQTPEVAKTMEGHMANIRRMGDEGKLLIAGPFTDGGELRGLYVFRAGSMDEARALVETDPAVKTGRFRFEIHPWFAAKNVVVTPHAASPSR